MDSLCFDDDLYMVRQGDNEPLREYGAQFSHEYSSCLDTDDRVSLDTLKSGLSKSNFRYIAHSSNWGTYAELMKHTAIHAKAEYLNFVEEPLVFQSRVNP